MAATITDTYGGVPTQQPTQKAPGAATDPTTQILQPPVSTSPVPSTTMPPVPSVPTASNTTGSTGSTSSGLTPPPIATDPVVPVGSTDATLHPLSAATPASSTTPASTASSAIFGDPAHFDQTAYNAAAQTAAGNVATDNAAAHQTTNVNGGTQGTDAYGTNLSSGAPGATASNTYDAQTAANLTPEETAAWNAYQAQDAVKNTGTPYTGPLDLSLANSPAAQSALAKMAAAQGASNTAMANAYTDPTIKSQYFAPDGTPLTLDGSKATTSSATTPGTTASDAGAPSSGPPTLASLLAGLSLPAGSSTTSGRTGAPTAAQQIAQLTNQFITPGRQTTANNTDPLSGVTTIDPTNDLRSTVITDTPDARTASYQTKVDQAASNLPTDRAALSQADASTIQNALGPTAVTAGPAISTDPTARLQQLQSLVDSASSSLASVDRYKLAQDQFNTFASQTDPAFQLLERQATQRAAAAGGLEGGKLRTDYGNLDLQRERDLQNERDTLFQNALNGSIQDQFNKTSALSGLEGQLTSEQAQQIAEQQAERQYGTNVDTGNVDRSLSAAEAAQSAGATMAGNTINDAQTNLGDLANLEQMSSAENLTGVNDLRGERSYQNSQANDAFTKALAEYQAEQNAKQQSFTNNLNLLSVGDAGNPANTLSTSAGQIGAGLDANGIAQLAASLGKNSVPNTASGVSGISGTDLSSLLAALTAGNGSSTDPTTQTQLNSILASLPGLGVQTTPTGAQ